MHRTGRSGFGALVVVAALAGCDGGGRAVVVDPGPMIQVRGELEQSVRGNVRGTLPVEELLAGITQPSNAVCRGYYERSSVVMLELLEPARVRAAVELPTGSPDTTMLIRGPGGVYCDDDSNGQLRPRIDQVLDTGIWWVHVGTFTHELSTEWTMALTVLPTSGRQAQASEGASGTSDRTAPPGQPARSGASEPAVATDAAGLESPAAEVVAVTAGQPLTRRGVVEANQRVQPIADARSGGAAVSGCRGYVERAPSVRLNLDAPRDVTITVTDSAGRDSVMMIAGPGGVYCDDDSAGGLRPQLVQRLGAGVWDVHVGTYSEGTGQPMAYTLQVVAQ